MKLTVSFFRSGTLLPDGSSSVPFFRLRSFCSFCFLFWLVLFSLVLDRTTTQRKFFPAVKYQLFRCSLSLPFLGSNDCVFPVLPLHPLRKSQAGFDGSSSTTISSQRCRHKRSPSSDSCLAEVFMIIVASAIWMIFTSSRLISFDHPAAALSGPNARAIS